MRLKLRQLRARNRVLVNNLACVQGILYNYIIKLLQEFNKSLPINSFLLCEAHIRHINIIFILFYLTLMS